MERTVVLDEPIVDEKNEELRRAVDRARPRGS